jgi:hypothetical protein
VENHRFEISATASFQGAFLPFHLESDFVVVIKIVPCIVLYIVVKFANPWRWLMAAPMVVAGRYGSRK